jgi:thymidylate synthase (FAD)
VKIIQPYMKIQDFGARDVIEALRTIEAIGRISHRSEEAQTPESYIRFIKAVVMSHGDWSIVEHINVRVEAYVDRGITHEIVRHRIGSYTQESTRFVNYEKKMPPSFIYPKPEIVCARCIEGDEPTPEGEMVEGRLDIKVFHSDRSECAYDVNWFAAIQGTEIQYRNLLQKGWSPQLARSVFPNALASKISITYNLRTWRHFFLMRTSKEAHPQMRQVTIPLLADFQRVCPILFDDIFANDRQADNLKKGR